MTGRILSRETVEKLEGADRVLRQAERMREAAAREAERLREDLLTEARQRALRESARTAARIVAEAKITAERQLKEIEPALARLVSDTVEDIIGAGDREETVRLATIQALKRLRDHRRARLLAAPDVIDAVRAAVASLPDDNTAAEVMEVAVDERLEAGRTLLSSDRGHAEIGLPDQVAAATEAFRGVIGAAEA